MTPPTVRRMSIEWNTLLGEQLDWHWTTQLRPRLDGLTDDEYLWEPAPGSWNVRPRGAAGGPGRGPHGAEISLLRDLYRAR